jgi:hypothetical protein
MSQSVAENPAPRFGAGGAFRVQQAAARARHGGMGEEDLARRDRRIEAFGAATAGAKEGELEADVALRRVERAGDIPPLGAESGMAAVIAREGQGVPRRAGAWRGGVRAAAQAGQQQRSQQEVAATHGGFCATAPRPAPARPAGAWPGARRSGWPASRRRASPARSATPGPTAPAAACANGKACGLTTSVRMAPTARPLTSPRVRPIRAISAPSKTTARASMAR